MSVKGIKNGSKTPSSNNSIKPSIVSLTSDPSSMSGTSRSLEKHASQGKSMVTVRQVSKNDDAMSLSDSDNELFFTPPASPSSPTGGGGSTKILKHKASSSSSPSLASISSSLSESFRIKSHSRASSTTSTISSTSSKSFHKRNNSSVSSTSSVTISSPVMISPQSLDFALKQGIDENLVEDITRISANPPRPAPVPPVLIQRKQRSFERLPPTSPTQTSTNFQPINKSPLQQALTVSQKHDEFINESTTTAEIKSDSCLSGAAFFSDEGVSEFNNILSPTNLKAYNPLQNQIQQQQQQQQLSEGTKTKSLEVTSTNNQRSPQSSSELSPTREKFPLFSLEEVLPSDISNPITPASHENLLAVSSASPLLRSFSSCNTSRYEDFTHLTYLDISASESTLNFISATGRLPRWIQKCTSLQYLIGCKLNLTVIEEWVSQCLIQLRVLRLNDNQISTWPDHLAQLLPYDQLTVVDLEGNPCFTNFCERCPQFGLDYAKSIDNSSREASKKFLSSRIGSQPVLGLKKKQGSISKKTHHRRISVPTTSTIIPHPSVSSPTSSASPSTLSSPSLVSESSFDSNNLSADFNSDSLKKKPSSSFFGRRHKKSYSAQLQNTISKLSNLSTTSIETAIGNSTSLGDTFISEGTTDKKTENVTEIGGHEDSTNTEVTLNSPTEVNYSMHGSSSTASNIYIDDDSDDEALTSLEPVINTKFIGRETLSSPLLQELSPSTSPSITPSSFSNDTRQASWASKQRDSAMFLVSETPENISKLLSNQLGPDTWTQKRIEPSEVEKSKVVLNLLRDIWEMSTNSILYHVPDLTAEALEAATMRRNSVAHDAKSDPVFSRLSPISSTSDSKLQVGTASSGAPLGRFTIAERRFGHGRANSADVIPKYSVSSGTEHIQYSRSPQKITNKEMAKLLFKMIEEEKAFVKRVNELITIYVKSKKCPPKAAKIFNDVESIYNLHSETVYPGLQRAYEKFLAHKDPNLELVSSLILTHINDFRVYIRYEVSLDESLRLANFWKRLIGGDSSQNMVSYGANVPHLSNYTHPDAIIAEWIKNCHRHKSHSLGSVTDYLQLPTYHLEKYRDFLKNLSSFSPGLWDAHVQFESICKEIEEEKPLAAEARRYEEFDQAYDFSSQLPARISPSSERRYLGDAVVLLRSEVFLELPTKQSKADCIHYMTLDAPHCTLVTYGKKNDSFPKTKPIFEINTEISAEENPAIAGNTNNCNSPTSNGSCRANPVPKVVQKHIIKSKFNLALHRIIVFDDVIVFTDEDKKGINRVVPRSKITVTLPWKYPVREGAEALPTGDQVSYKSKSSANSVYNQNRYSISSTTFGSMNLQSSSATGHHKGSGNSGALRMMFHDDPKIWYCTLRSFNCERKLKSKEPRSRLVELFTIS
ncbi:uncharacterized protein SAPINGB_P004493 [Magnusiomyces paraingens]|uniref:DH domain-containing protein n=1 Tax=Magnusiomyces paraingens TaxID=2606893 RepID=A0A5E8BUR1_9ASCO|nr:uncharacterized protein SAPINGB_P004493 [Saprochaete ingens]VVT55232.1 unnamed protein product [Saprochaete ingens]